MTRCTVVPLIAALEFLRRGFLRLGFLRLGFLRLRFLRLRFLTVQLLALHFLTVAIATLVIATLAITSIARSEENQVLELRTYTLVDAAAEEKLDAYLERALLPALLRQGLGPVGVFDQAGASDTDQVQVMLLVPGPNVAAVTGATEKLVADAEYQQASLAYLNTPASSPLVQRIRSELLVSFDCWPKVVVPRQKQAGKHRLFELRIYESPTEQLGHLKVEMFNSGEVPIFLDCQIRPVFMGQAIIGDKLPNLTYMTVYDDDTARNAGWKKFSNHADWQVLRAVEKYQGTVSKIHKSDWVPKAYSQL